LSVLFLILSLAGAAYLSLALYAVLRFGRRPCARGEDTPSVTVLKPLCGAEPGLYEHLASFCAQEYPDFEIVFCLHDEGDSAHAAVRAVVAAFPNVRTRVAFGENPRIANPKIANLCKPGAEPAGEIVVIADSDILAGRDYLRAIAASFSSERTGAVTCLYGGIPNPALASHLGAMHVEDEFAPSVLVALLLGPLRFCLGATMAVRREALAAIGGLAAIGAGLADDHALGNLVAAQGYDVELSRYAVRTAIPETTLRELWTHELRWARTNFTMAPAGYAFSFVMYAFPFALAYLALSQNVVLGTALCALIAALRLALHYAARSALRTTRATEPWLFPLRDLLSLAIWAASLATRTVRWRGIPYDTSPERNPCHPERRREAPKSKG